MILNGQRTIHVSATPESGSTIRIKVCFMRGGERVPAAELVVSLYRQKARAALKQAIADLEAAINGQFESGELVDLTNHFRTAAESLGYQVEGRAS